ncbi:MAG: ATP-binding cassette domain-containing protein [Lachnospiraceae bacterium]|nr:ATP-binding cassette domain-containing protein [Lachnospiraceae bacterium]
MGWFEEQILAREKADQAVFEDSFRQMAGAVMGKRIAEAFNDDRQIATDAIGEILKYYKIKQQEVPETIRDMNEVLEFLLRPSGIMRRPVQLGKNWYRDAMGAMLGVRKDDGSVVALIPSGLTGYSFFDRKTGKTVKINHKTREMIEPEAVAFYKPFPLEKMSIGSFMKYIISQIRGADIVLLLITMAMVTGTDMLLPTINNLLFSDVIDSGSGTVLLGTAIFMVCVTVSSLLFISIRGILSAKIGIKLNLQVEASTMMRILTLPTTFFRNYSAGELSNRAAYITGLCGHITSMMFTTGLTALLSLVYIVQIFAYAPALTWPAFIILLITLMVTLVQIAMRVKVNRETMEIAGKESGMSYQMISGVQKIRLSGAERRAFARWGSLYAKEAALKYDPPLLIKLGNALPLTVSLIGTIVLYSTAIRSGVSIAEYYAFNVAFGMVSASFTQLASMTEIIAQVKPMLEMAKPIFEAVPEIAEDKPIVTRLSGSIELNNITFRYTEDMPPVLDDLTLKIRPGQYVAIVGGTGCGKSTLMRMMLGFETPQKGAVYYDGRDLKRLDLKSVRRRIGTVLQDGKLLVGSIFENITVSAPWLTVNDAWEAAEISGLADDIRDMPMGMYTMISEGQGGISGGQRQRLLIARAIAPKPKVLMLDEATSALDNITQKQVSEALAKMNCTRIVIAHRLSTIRQCDRIVMLEGGKIVEDGTYEELIELNGRFAALVERQRLDDEKMNAKAEA